MGVLPGRARTMWVCFMDHGRAAWTMMDDIHVRSAWACCMYDLRGRGRDEVREALELSAERSGSSRRRVPEKKVFSPLRPYCGGEDVPEEGSGQHGPRTSRRLDASWLELESELRPST